MEQKIELFVAGVVHQDPRGRYRVQRWLNELILRESRPPYFVAVEWDDDHLESIISQRPRLVDLARAQWPRATVEFIQALADAMGYEGDSHGSLLPSVETVWLDEGREPDKEEMESFAELRMTSYKAWAAGLEKFDAEALEYMSIVAWKNVSPRDEGPNPRDDKFARRLFAACDTNISDWAIAILGVNRTADSAGSAIDLLIHNGISCHVTNMAPDNISA